MRAAYRRDCARLVTRVRVSATRQFYVAYAAVQQMHTSDITQSRFHEAHGPPALRNRKWKFVTSSSGARHESQLSVRNTKWIIGTLAN